MPAAASDYSRDSEETYPLSNKQIQRLGKTFGLVAGSQILSAYFGLYATVEGFEGGAIPKKHAVALAARFHEDTITTLSELLTLPTTLGESDKNILPEAQTCLRSLIRQADYVKTYLATGDKKALAGYYTEFKIFESLIAKLESGEEAFLQKRANSESTNKTGAR